MQAGEAHEFKVGDKAVYPTQGVAEVVSIEEKNIAGNRQQFYVLRILDTDRKILVPVKTAQNVGLRPPISETDIREIFMILNEDTIAFDNQTWNRRYRGFMDKIKTGSVFDVAEVMRDLYRLRAEKSLSFGEVEDAAGGTVRQTAAIQAGISSDKAKEINKFVKEHGPKGISSQTQGEQVRVQSKKRDDLQTVISAMKEHDFDIPLQFINFRD